jgi:hypothetical protein
MCHVVENHPHHNLPMLPPDDLYDYLNVALRELDALDVGSNIFRNCLYLLNYDQYISCVIYTAIIQPF